MFGHWNLGPNTQAPVRRGQRARARSRSRTRCSRTGASSRGRDRPAAGATATSPRGPPGTRAQPTRGQVHRVRHRRRAAGSGWRTRPRARAALVAELARDPAFDARRALRAVRRSGPATLPSAAARTAARSAALVLRVAGPNLRSSICGSRGRCPDPAGIRGPTQTPLPSPDPTAARLSVARGGCFWPRAPSRAGRGWFRRWSWASWEGAHC